MKGDFTRSTFDPHKHFTRVLTQQGRVQLDADGNEQVDILWHYLRTLATDLIGPHGGPNIELGFEITLDQDDNRITDLTIGFGRYYVGGLLCENEEESGAGAVTYCNQPDYPLDENRNTLPGLPFLVYLDVWEHHLTAIEDPDIREDALGVGGPDTATRTKVAWQVKTTDEMPDDFDASNVTKENVDAFWHRWVEKWQPRNRGELKAQAKDESDEETDPCIIAPEARYRGAENQLYRVEIHRDGSAWDESDSEDERSNGGTPLATFKWSRDNGSVTFPIIRPLEGNVVTLEHLGRDSRLSLKVGDWVEIENDDYAFKRHAEKLLKVEAIDPIDMQVTLSGEPGVELDPAKRPLLRRWDHGARNSEKRELEPNYGELEPVYGDLRLSEDTWITLEDSVQICFQPATQDGPHIYRRGDYWLIPARTATGDVEWPGDVDQPEARPPHGVEHHYAPLAIVIAAGDGSVIDCRRRFEPNATVNITPIGAKHSGKVLDVTGASFDSGAQIIQWDWHGGGNQLFRLEAVVGGYYRLVAKHSGKVLDVTGASFDSGAQIIQWDWHGGDNQLFRPEPLGDGCHRLVAKHSGKVLDVTGASFDSGAQIIQWDWHGGDNQRWRL